MEPTRITLTPHTHWDREWYEPFTVFSSRLEEMMETLIDLGEHGFPHFHLDGQTSLIDDYLAVHPDREDAIRRLAAGGQLSVGPWFTQMDEFLTSGESHIRNLEMGLARARDLAGDRALTVGYMPDQFGHIGQMPQILRNGGLGRAMVWRGVPTEIASTVFRWQAPDGSEILTEYLVFGYFNGGSFAKAIEPAELAGAIQRSVDDLRPFMASDRMIVMVGYDHAGPDATLPERLAAARALMRDVEATISGIAHHVEGQHTRGDLPVWRGELRSSARAHLLPGVYSARVHQKRERGRLEDLVERYAEPLAALAPGFGWPAEELRRAWTLLLWNGAHDSACGCSHDQVALDVDERFAEVRTIAEDIVERALTSLGSRVQDGGVIRFNPSPFEREGVPALGYAVAAAGHDPVEVPVAIEPIDAGVRADGVTLRLFDEPDVGDLYNFCYAEERQVPSPPLDVQVLRGHEVEAVWDGLRVLFRIVRRTGEDFLRLEGVIHNERADHRLRLHAGLPSPASGSLAGSPFELVRRPLAGEGSDLESASRTWPARGVAMASGTAVFHEGVFEYEVVDGRELAVTLLRSVGTISRARLATRPFAAGPDVATPLAQMRGETAFTLGIWPGADEDRLLENRERFAMPLAEAPAAGGGSLPSSGSLLEIEGDAQLSGVRRRDGRAQVRMWNPSTTAAARAVIAGGEVLLGPAKIVATTVG